MFAYQQPDFEALLDEEVVARVRKGETALYEIIMRRYNRRLFRIARSILRSYHEAEDVVQEAYVRAYLHLDKFAGKASFATWLTKIAIYEALARAKREDRLEAIATPESEKLVMRELKSSAPDPETQALTCEARAFLEAAVDTLPDNYRSVFMMREIEGMTTAETADCLEITEETVKMRLHRARELVRTELYARAGAASSKAFEFLGRSCDRIVQAVLQRIHSLR
jgi:RNA polymerase sigma-70 factor (ECF subfamily)